jgi:uncharacterized membrane protein YccC
MMVCLPGAGGSVRKSLLRLVGTLAAALVSIALAGLFAQNPPLLLASMFAVWAVGAYGMTGSRNQYAWSVFGFTSGIILIGTLTSSSDIETLAFERSCMVALGIVIVFIVEGLLWPESVEATLRTSLADRLREIGENLRPKPDGSDAGDRSDQIATSGLIADLPLVDQLRNEIGVSPATIDALSRAPLLIEGLRMRSRELRRRLADNDDARAVMIRRSIKEWATAFAEVSSQVAANLTTAAPMSSSLADLNSRFEEIEKLRIKKLGAEPEHSTNETLRDQLRTIALASAVAPILRDLTRGLQELSATAEESRNTAPEAPEPEPRTMPENSRIDRKSLWESFSPNRVEIAIRTGIATAGSVIAMMALGWTPNALAVSVAFNLAAAPTRGGFKTAAIGIVAVILVAWGVSDFLIVFVTPHVQRMPAALMIAFGVAAGFTYLGARSAKLGAVVPIFVLVVVLGVFGGSTAPQNVEGPYNTTTYFLLAVLVTVAAQSLLWPRRASEIFLTQAAGQLRLCGQGLRMSENLETSVATPHAIGTAELLKSFAAGTAKLGQLHGQACSEVEDSAESAKARGELMSRLSDLFDAIVHMRQVGAGESTPAPVLADNTTALGAAVEREEHACRTSVRNTIAALEGESRGADSDLGDAIATTEMLGAKIETWKTLSDDADSSSMVRVMAELDARHRIARLQLEIERWVASLS